MQKEWTLYMLRCADSSLYTGITKDVASRVEQHNTGKGAKYMRAHGPGKLVWSKGDLSESEAKKEEFRIKQLSRKEKEELIASKAEF